MFFVLSVYALCLASETKPKQAGFFWREFVLGCRTSPGRSRLFCAPVYALNLLFIELPQRTKVVEGVSDRGPYFALDCIGDITLVASSRVTHGVWLFSSSMGETLYA